MQYTIPINLSLKDKGIKWVWNKTLHVTRVKMIIIVLVSDSKQLSYQLLDLFQCLLQVVVYQHSHTVPSAAVSVTLNISDSQSVRGNTLTQSEVKSHNRKL